MLGFLGLHLETRFRKRAPRQSKTLKFEKHVQRRRERNLKPFQCRPEAPHQRKRALDESLIFRTLGFLRFASHLSNGALVEAECISFEKRNNGFLQEARFHLTCLRAEDLVWRIIRGARCISPTHDELHGVISREHV